MSHTFSNILIHVIFGTKARRPLILPAHSERLYAYMAGIAREEFGHAIKIGGMPDHVHALLRIGTDISVGQAVSKFKSLSSGWAHKNVPELHDLFWQTGYGAFSVSRSNVGSVVGYIEAQESHHKVRTFQEEFVAFLQKHGVEYDPEHVWD